MCHSELIELLLGIHVAVLLGSLAAFYAYSDRTDGFAASLKGNNETLRELRRKICRALEINLNPVFESPGAVPSPVLGPNGGTYVERSVNPVGSEIYRESIRDFLEDRIEFICDYHSLFNASKRWCFWTDSFRNIVLGLFCWQLFSSFIFLIDKATKVDISLWVLASFSTISVLAIMSAIISVIFRLIHYRTIVSVRLKYAEL
ncbi:MULTISPECIES: hypothetical protein [Gimesia]|uniref:DUF2721 domain-containing protein n=1 Tax=Gimesia maris TaxID=122 RepID=A0ABX5YQC3_9PLAN|nr:hypothetical protein [Gimesia maris]QEG17853.1 hypothetical protein GmarT_37370 [Gimesia maris]QGQ29113.1 hypothetical protein F1729_10875 [Gimesia maris]